MGGCCERKKAFGFDARECVGGSDDAEVMTQDFVISQYRSLVPFLFGRVI